MKENGELMVSKYTIKEIKLLLSQMEKIYDKVRLVSPDDCKEINITLDGDIEYGRDCFLVWEANQRCANCGSYRACQSDQRLEKIEIFKNNTIHVLMIPIYLQLKDGTYIHIALECINKKDVLGEGFVADRNRVLGKDGTALVDSLTGLYNWDGFYTYARESIENEKNAEWVILVYDIVKFKFVNDIFGIEKGNEVLMTVGQHLKSKLKKGELCARLRTDQFAVLIHKESFNESYIISASSEFPNLINSSQYHLHIQVGVYYVTDKSIPISSMCDRALIALSTIKDDRSMKVAIFDNSIMDKMLHEQFVISECEKAIKNGEFKMYLQPQVKKDGRIIGAEALSRWVRSSGEIVPPIDFIEILEKSELIVKLDTYIWEEAAKKLSEWKGTDKEDLYISVNISPKDFFFIDVYTFMENLVKKYDIDKSKLRLEITETIMMRDAIKQLELVNRLHSNGFEIEIDDFGKGYSSLSMLKDISADTLKIDKEFLRETDNDIKSENILGSVIDMTDRLSMKVITEGVETKEQLDRLERLGCHTFQGFYFARPMSVQNFEDLWLAHKGKCS